MSSILGVIAAARKADAGELMTSYAAGSPVRLPSFLYRFAYDEAAALGVGLVPRGHGCQPPTSMFHIGSMSVADALDGT